MSEDERENRRTWIVSIAFLVGALAILFGIFELRVRYASADAMDGYALLGDDVLVVDRLHGGGESSPPGGTRIFRLDGATGRVAQRKRVSESDSFLAVIDGLVWMRVYAGTFEAFDLTTLERRRSEKELLQLAPQLRALVGIEHDVGCLDVPMGAYRFTDESGKYVAFRFRDQTIVSVPTTSCPPQRNVEANSGKLADGRTVALKNLPNGKREGLFIGDAPVGTLSFLEAHLLSTPGADTTAQLLSAKGSDVFVIRRVGMRSEDPTEVVRVDLSTGSEKWSARIHDQRRGVEQADIHNGSLFLRCGSRLSVIDVETGVVRWRRGD